MRQPAERAIGVIVTSHYCTEIVMFDPSVQEPLIVSAVTLRLAWDHYCPRVLVCY